MNVLQILTITTVGFLAFVAFWVTKAEDILMTKAEKRSDRTLDQYSESVSDGES